MAHALLRVVAVETFDVGLLNYEMQEPAWRYQLQLGLFNEQVD